MIATRSVTLTDPLARANVVDALGGAGGPAGVVYVLEDGDVVTVRFDDAVSAAELVDDLIAIESVFVPARSPGHLPADEAAAIAAAGLGDPELDGTRVIETYLEEPRR